MRKLVTPLLFALAGFLFFSVAASAQPSKKLCSGLPCWGEGSKPGGPTDCIVKVSAPSIAGTVGFIVRDANGKPRWSGPRNKKVSASAGRVTYGVGCDWFSEQTEEAYMCVYGLNGEVMYYSRRTRSAGELTDVLKTRRLDMCLLGPDCPGYVSR